MHHVFRLLLFLVAAPALAQTVYSWEDEDGVHYTDDPTQVPKKGQVEVQTVEIASSPASSKTVEPAQAPAPSRAAPPQPAAPAANDEREWRARFITANRRISTLRQELSALEKTLPPPTRCVTGPVTPQSPNVVVVPNNPQPPQSPQSPQSQTRCDANPLHELMKVRIEQKKVELRDAEIDLEQLDRQASYDSIPREWRRGW